MTPGPDAAVPAIQNFPALVRRVQEREEAGEELPNEIMTRSA